MLEKLIKKSWFYLILVFLLFMPSIVQHPVSPEQAPLVVQEVLQNPLIYKIKLLFPVAKMVLLLLFIGPLLWKNQFRKSFAIIVSIISVLIAFFQNISTDTRYGSAILLGNIIVMVMVILSWIYEIRACQNDFSKPRVQWWNIILLMLSFFAFWMPAQNGKLYFSVKDLLLNEAGLTYCMVTPFILGVLLLYYPRVNKVTLRITSFVGLLFGIINMLTWFVLNTEFWWMGIIHLPLLINSIVSLFLSKNLLNK
jgi:hypothetical protein